jgi:hypothetical protein
MSRLSHQQIPSHGEVIIAELGIKRKTLEMFGLKFANQFSNHNMDPDIVGSPQFGQLFKVRLTQQTPFLQAFNPFCAFVLFVILWCLAD